MAQSTVNSSELTAEQVASVLTQPLEAASVFLQAGPRIFDTSGPLRIPKAPGYAGDLLEWTGENEQITEQEHEFDELQLLPSTMQSLKTITRYSNELARQSVVSLEAAIRSRMVADVAGRLDAQLLSDQGDGVTTPMGLFAYEGTGSVAAGGPLSLATMIEAQGTALEANVNTEAARWLIRPSDFTALRGVTANDGRALLQPDATQGNAWQILGNRVLVSSRIPAGRAAFVDFSQIAVARDLAPSVKILTERYADFDQQAIRVVARYDAGPLNAEAVTTIDGITAE